MSSFAQLRVFAFFVAGLVALSASPSAAADGADAYEASVLKSLPLKVGASFWTRYEMREGYDTLGVSRGRFIEGDMFVYRARLSLASDALSIGSSGYRARVFFSPQADGFWGDQAGTVSNPNLGIYEGFLRLEGPNLRFDAGHFALNYGDALVIGDLRWHQTARSFDGARLRIKNEKMWVDAFWTYINEGLRQGRDDNPTNPFAPAGISSIFAGETMFAGIYSSIGGLLSKTTTLEPYLLSQIATGGGGADPAVQMTLGVRALQKLGLADLRIETGGQFGRRRIGFDNPEALAWHIDFEIGFALTPAFRLSFEGLYASGDNPDSETLNGWDPLFPTGHKFLGLMDVIGGRTNIGSGVLHARFKAGDFTLKFDMHTFFRPETAEGQESFAGVEGNLNVIYLITKGMTLRAMYAAFIPGSDHYFTATDDGLSSVSDPAHYVEVQYGLQL